MARASGRSSLACAIGAGRRRLTRASRYSLSQFRLAKGRARRVPSFARPGDCARDDPIDPVGPRAARRRPGARVNRPRQVSAGGCFIKAADADGAPIDWRDSDAHASQARRTQPAAAGAVAESSTPIRVAAAAHWRQQQNRLRVLSAQIVCFANTHVRPTCCCRYSVFVCTLNPTASADKTKRERKK